MNKNFIFFGATALSRPISVENLDRRYAVWPKHYVPDNRGRNIEKNALALVKAETKRLRRVIGSGGVLPSPFISLSIKGKNMKMIANVLLFSVVLLAGCGADLPPHTMDKIADVHDGKRITLRSSNADLTREECVALIEEYRGLAGNNGQVGVRKPSRVLNGAITPWCVENFDGVGVVFYDNMF